MEKRKRAERALPLGDKLRRWGADPRLRWAVCQGILAGGGYVFTSAALFGQAHPFALAFGAAFWAENGGSAQYWGPLQGMLLPWAAMVSTTAPPFWYAPPVPWSFPAPGPTACAL